MREIRISYRLIDESYRHMVVPACLVLLLTKFYSDISIRNKEGEQSDGTDILDIMLAPASYDIEFGLRFDCHFQVSGPDEESVERALLSFQGLIDTGIDKAGHDIGFSRSFRELLERTHPNHEYLHR